MTVAVLSGGTSFEREVSLDSGRRVADALRDQGRDVVRLDLDADLVRRLVRGDIEAVFLALHGKAGEDGSIQRLLDLIGLPYTGSDATASALAWDKPVSKGIFDRRGVATPPWLTLSVEAVRELGAGRVIDELAADRLSYPLMVKPAQGGSSLGVRHVATKQELVPAVMSAFQYDRTVLLERFVMGTEVAVSVIDGDVLPVVEIHAREGAYDFAARYTHGATEFHVPARLNESTVTACRRTALEAWTALGCRHVMRADMIIDADSKPWLLEVDTCPGLTQTSLLPLAIGASDTSFGKLCGQMVDLARKDA